MPAISMNVGQTLTAIRLVQCGAGIALVEPFYFAAMRPEGLVSRPLKPRQVLEVVAVTPYGQVRSRAAQNFLKALREVVDFRANLTPWGCG